MHEVGHMTQEKEQMVNSLMVTTALHASHLNGCKETIKDTSKQTATTKLQTNFSFGFFELKTPFHLDWFRSFAKKNGRQWSTLKLVSTLERTKTPHIWLQDVLPVYLDLRIVLNQGHHDKHGGCCLWAA